MGERGKENQWKKIKNGNGESGEKGKAERKETKTKRKEVEG